MNLFSLKSLYSSNITEKKILLLLIKFQLLTVNQSQVLVCCLVLYSKTGPFWQVVFVGEEGIDVGGVRKVIYIIFK